MHRVGSDPKPCPYAKAFEDRLLVHIGCSIAKRLWSFLLRTKRRTILTHSTAHHLEVVFLDPNCGIAFLTV